MKVFHIDQFKCTLCSNWFCPPFNLPYRLKCTHSICTNCLQKSVQNKSKEIICPQDLQRNKISQININQSTKKALERLLKQHKNFTQTNHLQCIKSLSINFDELLDSKQIQLKNLSTLVDQLFQNQVKRLREIYQKIKIQINRPFRIVNDWKEFVRNYLKKVKNVGPNLKGCVNQLNHYIQEGRKIKLDLNQYLKYDFRQLIDYLLIQPQVCFTHNFSIFNKVEKQLTQQKYESKNKFQTLGKTMKNYQQVCLQDVTNNFDQSSIRLNKQAVQQPQSNSNKLSLFEQLIQETPKNSKCFLSHIYEDTKKTPFKEMIFSSVNNLKGGNSLSALQMNLKKRNQLQRTKEIGNEFDINNSEKINIFESQAVENDYNQLIKDKIRRLKTKETLQQSNNKKGCKMGKSLEYSPDEVQYSSQGFQNYAIHDSLEQDQIRVQNKSSQKQCGNFTLPNFYRQQTTLTKSNLAVQSEQHFNIKTQNESDYQEEEMLLDERSNREYFKQSLQRKNDQQLENINFLKEWKLNKNSKPEQELQIIQKYGGYDCQKEKNRYARKIQQNKVREILAQTDVGDNFISLVGYSLAECNIGLLLSQINWNYRNIEIVKFIKTSLNDNQLNQLLNFLVRSNVHTLMLSYNNLSQLSLDALLNFVQVNSKLKNIYLPKNNISLLKGNARTKMNLLKEKGINLYI